MSIAICHIRTQPNYRRDAFDKGLRAAGYRLVTAGAPAGPQDLFVCWNRYGTMHAQATAWEAKGGTVLVCENGYIGKDANGLQFYAISAHGHNGSGWWPVGDDDRWAALGIPLLAWRELTDEGHYLVCGQRGIGSPTMASPPNWHVQAAAQVARAAKHSIVPGGFKCRVRLHPGNNAPAVPLEDDLKGANACVIWSSSSGVKAMALGIPVIYDAPHWICEGAAESLNAPGHLGPDCLGVDPTERYLYPDRRRAALQRMAWAQWSVAEIESGEPFKRFMAEIAVRKAA